MPPGHTKPLIVHPRLALKLLDGHLISVHTLGAEFVSWDDRIICIFHSDGHWALLWGRLHVDTMCWKYCDGIPGFGNSTALRLASTISNELTLDWVFDPWHQVTQIDDHTCGTVALLHVGALLGLFGLPLDLWAWAITRRHPSLSGCHPCHQRDPIIIGG